MNPFIVIFGFIMFLALCLYVWHAYVDPDPGVTDPNGNVDVCSNQFCCELALCAYCCVAFADV